jgi:peptidoglycan/xylan/chitin deacetylase (PgdA/CDA1 family)
MGAIRQVIRSAMTAALPRRRFIVRGPGSSRQVALTFDDGPHPEHSPRLLDELARHNIKATFFVVGREAERHPGIVERAAREGHVIGHHSWTHSEPSETPAAQLLDEVRRSIELLQSITGKVHDRFRPPKGALTAAKFAGLWRAGQRIVLWSADPRDYRLADSGELATWAGSHSPAAGEIVLLHDVWPHAAAAIDAFAEWRNRSPQLEFVTLDAWLPAEASAR